MFLVLPIHYHFTVWIDLLAVEVAGTAHTVLPAADHNNPVVDPEDTTFCFSLRTHFKFCEWVDVELEMLDVAGDAFSV